MLTRARGRSNHQTPRKQQEQNELNRIHEASPSHSTAGSETNMRRGRGMGCLRPSLGCRPSAKLFRLHFL
eukprot:3096861-Pyramimonas_sp.AAC.1